MLLRFERSAEEIIYIDIIKALIFIYDNIFGIMTQLLDRKSL